MSRAQLLLATVAILAAALFANIIAARLNWRADLTADGTFTLSAASRQLVRGVGEPVEIELFVSRGETKLSPFLEAYARRAEGLLQAYVEASEGRVRLIITDPQPDTEAESRAQRHGLGAARDAVGLEPEPREHQRGDVAVGRVVVDDEDAVAAAEARLRRPERGARRRRDGHLEADARAAADGGLDRQRAAHPLGEPLRGREPEPHAEPAAGALRVERLEDERDARVADPGAAVAHLDDEQVALARQRDVHRALVAEAERVRDERADELPYAARVALHRAPGAGRDRDAHRHELAQLARGRGLDLEPRGDDRGAELGVGPERLGREREPALL